MLCCFICAAFSTSLIENVADDWGLRICLSYGMNYGGFDAVGDSRAFSDTVYVGEGLSWKVDIWIGLLLSCPRWIRADDLSRVVAAGGKRKILDEKGYMDISGQWINCKWFCIRGIPGRAFHHGVKRE